ncbi:MAG: cupin domain-containing protein [Solirubrobacterales bacterium]|nr:cupin domain-containing protein [Solirubrobacterales bacterium]
MTENDSESTTAGYTLKNLGEVEDMAAKHGFGEIGEARFANADLDTEGTGISFHRLRPNKRQGFGHRHEGAEEVYVVLSGSGRVKLEDEIVELSALDALRIAPRTARALEAGPDGMEVIAFGPRRQGDAEMLTDFWPD